MKTRNILLGLSVCAVLGACTDNDMIETGGSKSQQTFSGDNAYMAVRISDVGSSQTRATSPGFEYGNKKEQAVDNAYFYFYDGDGLFVSQGEVWEGGESSEDTTAGSIEFESNTVIILKGLTQKNYPKYVVTVLNKPAGLVNDKDIPETLDEMVKKLADDEGVGIMQDEENQTYFTMSTTSFAGQGITSDYVTTPLYFVTQVTEDDFHKEPVAYSGDNLVDEDGQTIKPVDIYVERLAAKVMLGVDLNNESVETDKGRTIYKIEETIAGDGNLELDENKEYAAQEIYIDLLGWKLNATARHSNIVKNINEDWTDDYLGFEWNDPGNHRSYWGKSFNYGIDADYPENSAGNASEDETEETTELNKYLKYVNLADDDDSPLLSLDGGYDYCAENTNTAGTDGIIQHRNSSVITSVLVKAQICDKDGEPQSVVRYSGELFTEEAYLNYIMLYLTQTSRLNLYTRDTDDDGNYVYSHLDSQYVKLEYLRDQEYEGIDDGENIDGYVAVVPDEDALASVLLYTKDRSGNYEGITTTQGTEAMKSALETFNLTAKAEGYSDGLMYYNIPIEHLNNPTGDDIEEAQYGVVRNHLYYVTITELENLGKGIYDEGEVLVPNPEDDEKETYYIGAKINILSWKVVQQDVKL